MITGAAHALIGRLAKVIYYNAVVPARGAAMVDENAEYAALTRAAIAASPDGTIGLVREQVPMLMPEADEQARDLFFELLVPQPGGSFLDPLDVDDVIYPGRAGYVLSEDDRALARPGAEFASRIGLTPRPRVPRVADDRGLGGRHLLAVLEASAEVAIVQAAGQSCPRNEISQNSGIC